MIIGSFAICNGSLHYRQHCKDPVLCMSSKTTELLNLRAGF